MNEVTAILQARMHSHRLPGKAMADLCGQPLIVRVIERLKATRGVDMVVLAIPEEDAGRFAPVVRECGVRLHPGSSLNVLYRFYTAARRFPARYIVRVTGDNPLIDTEMLERCIVECKTGNWDMVSCRDMPLGTAAEVFPALLLDSLILHGNENYHREHVTAYVYEHEKDFRIKRLDAPEKLKADDLRLTVDTAEDLALMSIIYNSLHKPGKIINLEKVISLLNDKPDLAGINANVRQLSWRAKKVADAMAELET